MAWYESYSNEKFSSYVYMIQSDEMKRDWNIIVY